jgi:hypothetical protein
MRAEAASEKTSGEVRTFPRPDALMEPDEPLIFIEPLGLTTKSPDISRFFAKHFE